MLLKGVTLSAFHRLSFSVSGMGGWLGHPRVSPPALPQKCFSKCRKMLPSAQDQSRVRPMHDNVIYCYFFQQLRVPAGNREFPAQIRQGERRTACDVPSTSPGTQHVTTPGFSHLISKPNTFFSCFFQALRMALLLPKAQAAINCPAVSWQWLTLI